MGSQPNKHLLASSRISDRDWVVVCRPAAEPRHSQQSLEVHAKQDMEPAYDPATKTAPTVETIATDDTHDENTILHPGDRDPRPHQRPALQQQLVVAEPRGSRLTKNTLKQHQQQLDGLGPGDMNRWLDAAAPGFTRHNIIAKAEPGNGVTVRSKQSHASDGSFEMVVHPDYADNALNDIRAAGAMFDDTTIEPFVYNSPFLVLD